MSLKEIKLNMDVGKGPDEEDEPPAAVVVSSLSWNDAAVSFFHM